MWTTKKYLDQQNLEIELKFQFQFQWTLHLAANAAALIGIKADCQTNSTVMAVPSETAYAQWNDRLMQ